MTLVSYWDLQEQELQEEMRRHRKRMRLLDKLEQEDKEKEDN